MKPKSKKQATKVFELIDKRLRCHILARYGRIGVSVWGDCANKAIEYEDDIIEEIYGTRDWIKIGEELGLIKNDKPSKKKKPKRVKLKKKRVKLKKKRR